MRGPFTRRRPPCAGATAPRRKRPTRPRAQHPRRRTRRRRCAQRALQRESRERALGHRSPATRATEVATTEQQPRTIQPRALVNHDPDQTHTPSMLTVLYQSSNPQDHAQPRSAPSHQRVANERQQYVGELANERQRYVGELLAAPYQGDMVGKYRRRAPGRARDGRIERGSSTRPEGGDRVPTGRCRAECTGATTASSAAAHRQGKAADHHPRPLQALHTTHASDLRRGTVGRQASRPRRRRVRLPRALPRPGDRRGRAAVRGDRLLRAARRARMTGPRPPSG